jgi:hypothetical protein
MDDDMLDEEFARIVDELDKMELNVNLMKYFN